MPKTVYPKKLKESIFKRLAPPNSAHTPDETDIPTNSL